VSSRDHPRSGDVTRLHQQSGCRGADLSDVRTILLLLTLWGSFSVGAMRRWRQDRAVGRRDDQLRALLAGIVVPAPRKATDDAPSRVNAD
jgi:hypothetical protein